MNQQQNRNKTTRLDLPPRCRHHECVSARADELIEMGMTRLAAEIRASDLPVRCRKVGGT